MATKKKKETPTLNLDWLKSPVTTDDRSKSGIIEDKPRKPRKRGPNLKTPGSVRRFLAKCIKAVEAGELDTKRANSICYLASTLLKAMETGQLESRIDELEKKVVERYEKAKHLRVVR